MISLCLGPGRWSRATSWTRSRAWGPEMQEHLLAKIIIEPQLLIRYLVYKLKK